MDVVTLPSVSVTLTSRWMPSYSKVVVISPSGPLCWMVSIVQNDLVSSLMRTLCFRIILFCYAFLKNLYIIVDITINNTNIKYDNTHVKIEKIVSLTLISIPLL